MPDDLDDELRIAIMRLSRRMRLERADEDVTDGQLSALFVLSKFGPQTLSGLSEHERVTPPSMNRTVNALERDGLVTREPSPDDGRKVLVRPTERAAALVLETQRRRVAWFSRQLALLSDAQRDALNSAAPILRTLADS